jgi:hypothetical protein
MERCADETRRRNPNSRCWQAGVAVIPTCSSIEADAVPRNDHPVGGPNGPGELKGDEGVGRTKTARGGVVRMSERLRHRAADAEDQHEPREGFDEVHLRQA